MPGYRHAHGKLQRHTVLLSHRGAFVLERSHACCFQRCPFKSASGNGEGQLVLGATSDVTPARSPFSRGKFEAVDMDAVKADIETLLTDSQEAWPADFGNYGPFFVSRPSSRLTKQLARAAWIDTSAVFASHW